MKSNNQKKVLLINPPGEFKNFPGMSLGLASIAAYLKSKDIDISVIDAWAEDLTYEKLKNKVAQTEADIIGIYIVSPCYEEAKNIIETCRQALPKSIIVAGGPHPTIMPTETLKEIPQLDICCIGEGEITMFELVKAIQDNSQLLNVDGLAFREKENIVVTKPRGLIKNLDDLPLPARELFPLDKYKDLPPFGRKKPWFCMITSRGCPYQCTFCTYGGAFRTTYRARSPKKVVDEIEELIVKYGAREITFRDNDFTLDMSRAEEICDEIIRRGIKISWSCMTRVDLVSEKLLRKMKEAGCWLITYGVESGNQKILDALHKGITIEQTISAFAMTKKAGLMSLCSFMVSLPGETKENIQETVDLIKKIKPDFIGGGVLIVYPGSTFFKLWQEGKYPGRLKTIKKGDYLASVTFGKGAYTIFEDNVTLEECKEILKKVTRDFYLRPQYILQSLKSIRSFSDFSYYLDSGMTIIKSLIR